MGVADEVICIEPYTWATNAPNLKFAGLADRLDRPAAWRNDQFNR